MFNFSGSEMVFLLLLALIILGPEKLPDAIRKFTQTYGEFKKAATGFQTELKSALDEPMREMKATADELKKAASFDVTTGSATAPKTEPKTEPTVEPAAAPAGDAPPTLSPFQSAAAFSAAPPIRQAPPSVPEVPVDETVAAASDDTIVLPVVDDTEPIVAEPIVAEPIPEPVAPESMPEPIVPELMQEPIVAELVHEPSPASVAPDVAVLSEPERKPSDPVVPSLPPLPRTRVLSARPAPSATVPPPPPSVADTPPFAAPAWPQPAETVDEPGTNELDASGTAADEGSSPA